jgi:hypothetical protein
MVHLKDQAKHPSSPRAGAAATMVGEGKVEVVVQRLYLFCSMFPVALHWSVPPSFDDENTWMMTLK